MGLWLHLKEMFLGLHLGLIVTDIHDKSAMLSACLESSEECEDKAVYLSIY